MAHATTVVKQKRCIMCDNAKSSGGLFTCDGCQQMFCLKHVNEHRQKLNIQLENTMQEYDLFQEESSQKTPDQSVLKKIDDWETEAILKIKNVADRARIDFHQWYQSINDRIKKECGELATNLRSARETEDYSESDLSKWSEMLSKLKRYLDSISKVDITEDRQNCVNHIKLYHNIAWSTDDPHSEVSNILIERPTDTTTNRVKLVSYENNDSQGSSSCRVRRRR